MQESESIGWIDSSRRSMSWLEVQYAQDAGEGGRGVLQSIEEPREAGKEEELRLCFGGELYDKSLSKPSHFNVVICLPIVLLL